MTATQTAPDGKTFTEWLSQQQNRRDSVGEFAAIAKRDKTWADPVNLLDLCEHYPDINKDTVYKIWNEWVDYKNTASPSKPFTDWLLRQEGRNDLVGDLAKDAKRDSTWTNPTSLSNLQFHVGHAASASARCAWNEWQAWLESQPIHVGEE